MSQQPADFNEKPTDFNKRTLTDYITDQHFLTWVLTPTPELSAYWKNIQELYPDQQILMEKAAQVISGLNFKPERMNKQELEELWLSISAQIPVKVKSARLIPLWMRNAAAACLAFIFIGSVFYYYSHRTLEFRTAFGETKNITLPDGSVVTLNANSELHYPKNWSKDKKREVWVSGEAFFAVNHLHQSGVIKAGDRFIVHAGKLAIEVLGTTFNVHDRRGLVNVALVTGKISLERYRKKNIIMKPGEVLEYIPLQDTIIRKKIKSIQKIAWKNGTLEFYQTPVTDVFNQLEDMYGYKVLIKNPQLTQKKLTGTFVTGSEEALFKGLSVALGVTITKDKKSNQLIIK